MVKVFGLTAMRFSDDDVLPFDFAQYASALHGFVDAVVAYNSSAQVNFTLLKKSADKFTVAAQVC